MNDDDDGGQQQEERLDLAKDPTRLSFEAMYAQLAQWRGQHHSCHVPRNCFDAPPLLGAWVRHVRRTGRAGTLPHWQADLLDLLGFEWRLSDADAKWIDMLHRLRRFRHEHGGADGVPASLPRLARCAPRPKGVRALQHQQRQQGERTHVA